MRKIRQGTFETNSSSTHSITMCSESDFIKWKNGELYYSVNEEAFVNKDERDVILKKLVIYDKVAYDGELSKWYYKESYADSSDGFYTEENINEITQEDINKLRNEGYDDYYYDFPLTFDEYEKHMNESNYETYSSTFDTKDGDKVIAFGHYGNGY